jgi:NADP-dependent 3-hydroxy acid dehydrogenase YdfG
MLMVRAKLHADGFHTIKYVRLDVMDSDITTIQGAKETIDLAEGKLDVLVNNAGTFFRLSIFILSSKLIQIISY